MGKEARTHKAELGKQLEQALKRVQRLEDVIKALSMQSMQSFGSVYANEKALETFIEKLDMNDRAIRFIFLEMFGHLQQANTLLGLLCNDENLTQHTRAQIASLSLEDLKDQAKEWLERVGSSAFKIAEAEKLREEEENKKLMEQKREEAEKARQEAEQKMAAEANIEQALADADKHSRMSPAGGQGAPIPQGAYVFGGE